MRTMQQQNLSVQILFPGFDLSFLGFLEDRIVYGTGCEFILKKNQKGRKIKWICSIESDILKIEDFGEVLECQTRCVA